MLYNVQMAEYVTDGPIIKQDIYKVLVELSRPQNRIQKLSIFGIKSTEIILYLCNTLRGNHTLKSLHLNYCILSNEEIALLMEVLQESFISELSLISHNITIKGAECIANYLNNDSCLKELNLEDSVLSNQGFETIVNALKTNNTLHSLNLSGTIKHRINSKWAPKMIADALENNRSLKCLNLSANSIHNHEIIAYLGEILCLKTRLELLDLSRNPIGHSGISFLAAMLKKNVCLKVLILENLGSSLREHLPSCSEDEKNYLGDKGVKYIAGMLKINRSLKYLVLTDNYHITSLGILHLGLAMAENSTLNILELDRDKLLDNFDIAVLHTALENNKNLLKLHQGTINNPLISNLINNNIAQADKLARMLMNKTSIHYRDVHQLLQRSSAVQYLLTVHYGCSPDAASELVNNALGKNVLTLLGVKKNFTHSAVGELDYSNKAFSFLEALPDRILNKIINYNVFEDNVDKYVRNKEGICRQFIKALATKDYPLLRNTLPKMKHFAFDEIISQTIRQPYPTRASIEILQKHQRETLHERQYLDFKGIRKCGRER